MKKSRTFSFRYLLTDFVRITAIPAFLYFRPKRLYLGKRIKHPFKGGVLVVSNHISVLDPLRLMFCIPSRRHHSIMAEELCNNKLKYFFYVLCGKCILISRNNFGIKSYKTIVNHLKSGELVTIYPEGKVNNEDNSVKTFKSGCVMMANGANVPIVPVYMKQKAHWYSRVIHVVGEPIDLKKYISKGNTLSIEDMEKVAKDLKEIEDKMKELAYSYKNKKGESSCN